MTETSTSEEGAPRNTARKQTSACIHVHIHVPSKMIHAHAHTRVHMDAHTCVRTCAHSCDLNNDTNTYIWIHTHEVATAHVFVFLQIPQTHK